MGTRNGGLSVLMLPWLAHGHISALLELAKKLTLKNFYIYFCSTPINLNSIKNKLSDKYHYSIQLVELHLPSSPELPPHHYTTNGLPTHLMAAFKTAFEKSAPAFSNILKTPNPSLVIYDFNQPWVPAAASPLDIPVVLFLFFGALFISFTFHHVFKNPDVEYPFRAIHLHNERSSFESMLEFSTNGVKEKDLIFESIKRSRDVMLLKTSRGLEGKYIDYFSASVNKRIQPVGTLVQEPAKAKNDYDDGDGAIMEWLEKKDESLTVFVSFGSEYFLSMEEMEEIAHALELSKVNFVWVVRFPVGEKIRVQDVLPKGFIARYLIFFSMLIGQNRLKKFKKINFLPTSQNTAQHWLLIIFFIDRVGERGMVVEGWAPRVKIPRHSSIGGFVSHCGWNSVLESIEFGVPMHLDQPLNPRLIEEVGVGVEVKRDQTGWLHREEIARVLKTTVVEKME
ncbi:hypothetical protein ACSBR1_027490 [Camellia fascicularis]